MAKKKDTVYLLFILVTLGIGGVVGQTVLLRELFILFAGNEFSFGFVLGNWIICEAAGAFMAGRFSRTGRHQESGFIILTALFSFLLPAAVFAVRFFKATAMTPAGVQPGILTIFWESAVILLPVAFLHGALFIFSCGIYGRTAGSGPSGAGKAYGWETTGTVFGGLVLTYLLLTRLNTFQIAGLIAAMNSVACFALVSVPGMHGKIKKQAAFSILFLLFLSTGLFSTAGDLHTYSTMKEWPGQNLIHYENSMVENIAVTGNHGQYTFFANGIPRFTTPVPDTVFVEELTHFTLLSCPSPGKILILGNGAGGVINEILKYPTVKQIDYVETDPALLKQIMVFSTPLTESELSDKRVHLHFTDGRLFLKKTNLEYDVILVGLGSPANLQTNRFYTEEFFRMAGKTLAARGIAGITLPGTLTYYGPELKELNQSVLAAIEKVFPHYLVIPGDFNLFLASRSPEVEKITPGLLARRLENYGIITRLITPQHLKYRLSPQWIEWFQATVEAGMNHAAPNRDFAPGGLFFGIAYWNRLISPGTAGFLGQLKKLDIRETLFIITGLSLLFFLFAGKRHNPIILFAIGTTGFSGMVLELVILFSFQIFYGYVFYEIGVLLSLFMAGAAAGSLLMTAKLGRIDDGLRTLGRIEAIICLFSLCLVPAFMYGFPNSHINDFSMHFIFFFLLILGGGLVGMEFPLANSIYDTRTGTVVPAGSSAVPGILYGTDLLGGWFGGVLGGFLLLPLLGLAKVCLLLAFLKTVSLLFVLLLWENRKKRLYK